MLSLRRKRKGRHRRQASEQAGQDYAIPGQVLGWDDWLVFARREDGALVFRGFEYDPRWFGAPHEGEARRLSPEWRQDNAYMLDRIRQEDAADLSGWAVAEGSLGTTDEIFTAESAKVYLPERKELEELN